MINQATATRVGIDISSAVDPVPTGVARYIQCLIAALRELPEPPELVLLCRPSRRRRGDPRALFPDLPLQWLHPIGPGRRSVDVLHAPDLRLPRFPGCPTVATLHDLTSLKRSDHAPERFVRRKQAAYRRAARAATRIVTHSKTVRDEVVDRLGVAPERVVPVPLADPLPLVANAGLPRGDGLLAVGGPSRRKGCQRLAPLLAWWAEHLDWRPTITWVGSASREQAHAFLAELPVEARERVEFRGHVPDDELDRAYRTAAGLLMLSDSEGFGLPLLEAARRGCPVLALGSGPLYEVLGDHAFWFTESPEENRAVFERFGVADERRRVAAGAAQRASAFDWQQTAERTRAVYEEARRAASQRRG